MKGPGRDAVTFPQLNPDTASWISELDDRSRAVCRIALAPDRADYRAWTPAGVLLAVSPGGEWLAFVAEDRSER